jgi:hypothetical protein
VATLKAEHESTVTSLSDAHWSEVVVLKRERKEHDAKRLDEHDRSITELRTNPTPNPKPDLNLDPNPDANPHPNPGPTPRRA